jgi:hypothetical protein
MSEMQRARAEFPNSDSVRLFLALSLHAASRSDAAVAELLELAADKIATPEVLRYEAALRDHAAYLVAMDHKRTPADFVRASGIDSLGPYRR